MSKFKPKMPGPAFRLAFVFGALVLALTTVHAVPIYKTTQHTVIQTIMPGSNGKVAAPRVISSNGAVPIYNTVAAGGLQCAAGENGGSTDVGVTGTEIKLGATVVRTGIGSSFLGGAPTSLLAMVDRVNRAGGICGRQLNLIMRDDGWDRTRGQTFLKSFIVDDHVFALAVVPSSEGLDAIVESGDISQLKVPVGGTDGMLKSQYKDSWVWPVAASTVTSMHLMVKRAYDQGARTFGIVFDKDYRFGIEGATAFENAVERVTGHQIPGYHASNDQCVGTYCGISAGQLSYPEANTFNKNCQVDNAASPHHGSNAAMPSCDLVALLLDPTTALTWLVKSHGAAPTGRFPRTMGPQPLFSVDFAKNCGSICQGMEVWTSYNPPLPPYTNQAGVAEYVGAVTNRDPSIDTANSFTEGAYLGMKLLVDAIARVGPKLTRAALKQVLDSQQFDYGLSPALGWAPGNHLGAGEMQGYQFQYQGEQYISSALITPYLKDPWLGKDL